MTVKIVQNATPPAALPQPPNLPPETRLTRQQAAAALTEAGFPITAKALEVAASRGNGPAYAPWGRRVLYRWADLWCWALNRHRS